MKAIVAVDSNWGIGYQGKLLAHIPEDLKYFRKMTIGKVVVMGEKTFKSLPGGLPLTGRVNIVMSNTLEDDRVIVCNSMEDLWTRLEKYDTDDIFVIGGESVYRQLLKYCGEVYVTKIKATYKSDRYFNNLDKDNNWKLISEVGGKSKKGLEYKFTRYVNIDKV